MIRQNPAINRVAEKIDQTIAKEISFRKAKFLNQRRKQIRDRGLGGNFHRLWCVKRILFYIDLEHEHRLLSFFLPPPSLFPFFNYIIVFLYISDDWVKLAIADRLS